VADVPLQMVAEVSVAVTDGLTTVTVPEAVPATVGDRHRVGLLPL
jgi:hypothetical protein